MADEDVLEQARAAGLTIATGVSRLGDTFIRAAQQRAESDARDKQLQVEDAQRRYEAQAQVAEQLYRRASDPDWMRSVDQAEALGVWEAAQLWADLDQERFRDAAAQVTVAYRQAYGVDPSADGERLVRETRAATTDVDHGSIAARGQRSATLVDAGWPPDARHARTIADQLNAHAPLSAGGAVAGTVGERPVRLRSGRLTTHVRTERDGR